MCQLPKRGCNAILFWQHPQMNNEATRATSALAYVAATAYMFNFQVFIISKERATGTVQQ